MGVRIGGIEVKDPSNDRVWAALKTIMEAQDKKVERLEQRIENLEKRVGK